MYCHLASAEDRAETLGALTDRQEAARVDRWHMSGAPGRFVAARLRGIVGVEIPAARIAGKWKASRNRTRPDRRDVIAGLGGHPLAAIMDGPSGGGALPPDATE